MWCFHFPNNVDLGRPDCKLPSNKQFHLLLLLPPSHHLANSSSVQPFQRKEKRPWIRYRIVHLSALHFSLKWHTPYTPCTSPHVHTHLGHPNVDLTHLCGAAAASATSSHSSFSTHPLRTHSSFSGSLSCSHLNLLALM